MGRCWYLDQSGYFSYQYVHYKVEGEYFVLLLLPVPFSLIFHHKVPAVPASDVGQTIFLFNAIEPGTFNAIVQPVLQYGPSAAGGGSFWAVASWYISSSNEVFFTTPISVEVDQELTGVISLTGNSGSVFDYTTSFTGIDGKYPLCDQASQKISKNTFRYHLGRERRRAARLGHGDVGGVCDL
jgi:hypothetical protein